MDNQTQGSALSEPDNRPLADPVGKEVLRPRYVCDFERVREAAKLIWRWKEPHLSYKEYPALATLHECPIVGETELLLH